MLKEELEKKREADDRRGMLSVYMCMTMLLVLVVTTCAYIFICFLPRINSMMEFIEECLLSEMRLGDQFLEKL